MGENSKIEWTHHTFNPWRGCDKVSPGCTHCYAETLSYRNPSVLGVWGPQGTRVIASDAAWEEPRKWHRKAMKALEQQRVFCASLADVFEDRPELEEPRARLWDLIETTSYLDWLLLTKRPQNVIPMLKKIRRYNWPAMGGIYTADRWLVDPLLNRNIWVGVSVEDRKHGLPRIDILRGIPTGVRFLSVEPLLEDLGEIDLTGIGWVIGGFESGFKARPGHPDWARSLRDQCVAAGVPFLWKQWGEWAPPDDDTPRFTKLVYVHRRRGTATPAATGFEHGCPCCCSPQETEMVRVGKKAAGRLLDGREWNELPTPIVEASS